MKITIITEYSPHQLWNGADVIRRHDFSKVLSELDVIPEYLSQHTSQTTFTRRFNPFSHHPDTLLPVVMTHPLSRSYSGARLGRIDRSIYDELFAHRTRDRPISASRMRDTASAKNALAALELKARIIPARSSPIRAP